MLFTLPFLAGFLFVIWFVFLRNSNDSSTTNFSKAGGQVAVVTPQQKTFTTEYFSISLPSGWEFLGKKNPTSEEVYFEYQSKIKDYDNRLVRVYVDVYPKEYALNRLLPVTVVDNRLVPGTLSDDCKSFTGAPLGGTGASRSANTWAAKWQGVDFTCDMVRQQNYSGTASQEEGNQVTLVSSTGQKHKFFIVYIDQNVRPDYQIFSEAVKSFQTI
ncbi:MAG: hypothetical protein U0491_01775 [Candidatus Saccharimonadales bacterium]